MVLILGASTRIRGGAPRPLCAQKRLLRSGHTSACIVPDGQNIQDLLEKGLCPLLPLDPEPRPLTQKHCLNVDCLNPWEWLWLECGLLTGERLRSLLDGLGALVLDLKAAMIISSPVSLAVVMRPAKSQTPGGGGVLISSDSTLSDEVIARAVLLWYR